jgi:hypothetical protein
MHDALTRLDTFRPTEAAILRREITRLRRIIANRATTVQIVPGDLLDLASIIDRTRRHYPHPNVPPRHYADAIVSAGWLPPKGTG